MVRHVKRTPHGVTVTEYDSGPNHFSFSQTSTTVFGGSGPSGSRHPARLPAAQPTCRYVDETHLQSIMDAMDDMAEFNSLFDRMSAGGRGAHEERRRCGSYLFRLIVADKQQGDAA